MKRLQPETWQNRLRDSVLKFGFNLHLSRAMLEFLCAVADNVRWDRALNSHLHEPDNWIATEIALTRRGLIERKPAKDLESGTYRQYCRLTPAGECVVTLAKQAGIFVEACESAAKRRA